MAAAILVADDNSVSRKNIAKALEDEGHKVIEVGDGKAAIDALESADFDLILTDLKMPEVDGIGVLQHARNESPQTLVVLMTAYASVDTAVEAFRLGAQDYIFKPVVIEDVLQKVNRLLEHRSLVWEIQMLRREAHKDSHSAGLIGQSRVIQEIFSLISKVGPTTSNVLITGESGVGKEVAARAVHLHSSWKDKIFLPVNCSAIPETLLESQLFGHAKGAFTGAVSAQEGLFHRAQGGTIFLDEIGEMPVALQPKLLRAIEEKEVLPVGATRPTKVDVRIIASTNRELEKEVAEGKFREDLFYRLNVINIHVPPLRQRREDIPVLVEHLIRRHNAEMKQNYKGADSRAMKILKALPWKGNVRELDNVLERAMILGNGEWISAEHLPTPEMSQGDVDDVAENSSLRDALESYEKSHIQNILEETNGDRTKAARLLGVSRASLYRKIDKLGICQN